MTSYDESLVDQAAWALYKYHCFEADTPHSETPWGTRDERIQRPEYLAEVRTVLQVAGPVIETTALNAVEKRIRDRHDEMVRAGGEPIPFRESPREMVERDGYVLGFRDSLDYLRRAQEAPA